MSIYIETKRLILRQFTINDLEKLHSICGQTYMLKWMPDWKRTKEEKGMDNLGSRALLESKKRCCKNNACSYPKSK